MSATLEQERTKANLQPFPRFLEPGMHLSQPDFHRYQPDLHLRLSEELGGQCRESSNFLQGAPELEVARTSFSYDLHEKLEVYQNHRVREYLVWRGDKNQFSCYRLDEGSFAPVPTTDGVFKSTFFRGLWIDTAALAAGDLKKALASVQQGLQTAEAKEF